MTGTADGRPQVPRRGAHRPPPPDPGRRLVPGPRVDLHRPTPADARDFLDAVAASRALHHPWVEPARTPEAFTAYLRRTQQADTVGWLVRVRDSGQLAGVVNLNAIIWSALCTAHVGYYGFTATAGRGYLSEAVALAVREAFDHLRLHRIEANIQPGNEPSRALARRVGFRLEGFSPRFQKVCGAWRDHERWALTAEDLAERGGAGGASQ